MSKKLKKKCDFGFSSSSRQLFARKEVRYYKKKAVKSRFSSLSRQPMSKNWRIIATFQIREGLKLLKGQLFQQATASASKVLACFAQLSHASKNSHAYANMATSTTMCTWYVCENLSQEVRKKKGKVQEKRMYRPQDVSILFKGIEIILLICLALDTFLCRPGDIYDYVYLRWLRRHVARSVQEKRLSTGEKNVRISRCL